MECYRDGPQVTVIVEDRTYKLPKTLLCNKSTFFDKAFNGHFLEAEEQKVNLTSTTPQTFDCLVQWVYKDEINLEKPDDKIGVITQLADFIRLADVIDLRESISPVISTIRIILTTDRRLLQPNHVRIASDLPKDHELRKLFAQASVWYYAYTLRNGTVFCLQKELLELDGFRDDLFQEFGELVKTAESQGVGKEVVFRHPLV